MKYDVFISYSSQDQKIVEGICGYLEARGIRCFVAYRDIPRGVVWARAIVEALDESAMMLVAFSENFNSSDQVDREIELASEDRKPILTFRLSDSKFSGAKRYYLKNLNWIDAFPNPNNAFGDLYKNICKLLGKEEKLIPSVSDSPSSYNAHVEITSSREDPSDEYNQTNSLESQLEFDSSKGEFKPKTEVKSDRGFINEHEWVDLGLPSGLKWATCNVGASKPEEYGDYFSWGEIKPKTEYSKENSETLKKNNNRLTKNGYIGSNGNLTLSHDAARQNWGGTWRMPTKNEIEELINHTTTEWTERNGVKGRLVKSNKNGNTIFLPAAGERYGSSPRFAVSYGYYWSSTPDEYDYRNACYLLFNSSDFHWVWYYRYNGRTVRPVSE